MSINVDRSLEMPESEYFPEPQAKSGIALHHTVSDNAHSAVRRWHADMTATGKAAPRRDGLRRRVREPPGPHSALHRRTQQAAHQAAGDRRLRGRRGRGDRGGEGDAVKLVNHLSYNDLQRFDGISKCHFEIQICRLEIQICRLEIQICRLEIQIYRFEIQVRRFEIPIRHFEIQIRRFGIQICHVGIQICRSEIQIRHFEAPISRIPAVEAPFQRLGTPIRDGGLPCLDPSSRTGRAMVLPPFRYASRIVFPQLPQQGVHNATLSRN